MTEKRFTYLDASKNHYIGSFFCNDVPLTNEDVVDLLNENEQLENENQEFDEKICLLTMDLIKTKSYEQLEKELNRIKNENEGLKEDNAILKQALTRLVEAFDDKISDKSPIRDLIKITNHCSFCKECYFVDESKKFICKLNKKEINYATPACENFDESIWRKKFKDVENAIVDNIMRDFWAEKKKEVIFSLINSAGERQYERRIIKDRER